MNDQENIGLQEHRQKIQQSYEHKVRMQMLSNEYGLLILKWYFLLNSGGLIGTLTLLGLKKEKSIYLCIILAVLFAAGIYFIITACKLDRKRIIPEFDASSNKDDIPSVTCVDKLESLSIISFAIGLLIAIAFLVITALYPGKV